MTVDLAPYLDAVPEPSSSAPARRPACPRRRPREPRRRHARGHARRRRDRRGARCGRPTPVCTDPAPPLYDFLPGIERFRTDPDPAADYDLLVVVRLRLARPGRRGRATGTPSCSSACRASSSTTTPRTPPTGEADWIDPRAAATCEMVALLAARLGVAARRPVDGGAGDGADGRHRHGHRDVRPSQRHAADARRVGRAGRGRRAAVRHLAPAVPLQARSPAPAVRAGPRPPRERRRRAASSGRRCSTRTSPRPAPSRRIPRASSTCSPRPTRPRSRSCSRRPAPTTRISVRTKPGGVDATVLTGRVRRRRPRPRGRRDGRRSPSTRPAPPVLAEADAGCAADVRPLTVARSSLGPGSTAILVVDKPVGPTSHDIVGARPPPGRDQAGRPRRHARSVRVRRAAGLPRPGARASSSTTWPIAKAYRATVCFGASSTTDDLEGELTPADGPGADARGGRGGPARASPARSRSARRPTRRSRSAAAGRTRWPAPARRVELARRGRSRSTRSTSSTGTTPTRTGRSPSSTSRCSAGTYIRALARDLGARARQRRVPRGAAPDRRRARSRSTTRSPLDDDPVGRRGRPGRAGPAPAAASTPASTAFPVVALTARGRGRRARPVRPTRRPASRAGAERYRLRAPSGALVAIATDAGRAGSRPTRSSWRRRPAGRPDRLTPRWTSSRARRRCARARSDLRGRRRVRRAAPRPRLPARPPRAPRPPTRDARPTVITFDHHPDEVLTRHGAAAAPRSGRAARAARGGRASRSRSSSTSTTPLRRTPYDAFVERDPGADRRWPAC